jgi:Ricin-type beta-trefoil lectin domain
MRKTVIAVLVIAMAAGFSATAGVPASAAPGCAPASAAAATGCMVLVRPALSVSAAGYSPADLRAAYGLQSITSGTRQTVAVVAAYDDPAAEADLGVYRANYASDGLAACTTDNGCFRKVNQSGQASPLPAPSAPWAAETAADLDTVSAICPNCHLLLVEAASEAVTDMGAAVNEAVKLGAAFVDIGWAMPETAADTGYDASYFNHPGVAIMAPSAQALPGTTGYGLIGYPAASPQVTAVGGTTLTNTGAGLRGWTETAWSQSGSGCSAYEPKPARQTDTGCGTKRTVNDVAAAADPAVGSGAVASYDSYGDSTYQAPGWTATGGTSVAAAIITAVYALTAKPAAGTYPVGYPYSHSNGLNDITGGSTGTCATAYLCVPGTGYDAPTGMGTPWFTLAFDNSGALTGALYSDVFGKCVDDNKAGTANGNPIGIFTCNGGINQDWTLNADRTVRVYGKCLDVVHSGTTNGTKVDLFTCNGTGAQQWRARANGELVNPESGRCLEDPGASATNNTQLQIGDCTDGIGQRWTLPYRPPSSTGAIVSGVDASLCLDDYQNATANGTKIDIFTCNGAVAQNWSVTNHGDLEVNGKCLDVAGSKIADGSLIDLFTCNGSGAQQWRALSDGSLLNPESGKCLDDPGATTVIRTQMQLKTCDATVGQRWRLP